MESLYQDHLTTLQQCAQEILQRQQLDELLIHTDELIGRFLNNHDYPFKAWLPVTRVLSACGHHNTNVPYLTLR